MKRGMRFAKIGMVLLLLVFSAWGAEAAIIRTAAIQYEKIGDVLNNYLSERRINLNQHITIGDKEIYWNQRMVGEAIVEGATTVVQFNPLTKEYVEVQSSRLEVVDDAIVSPMFTREQITSMPQVIGSFLGAQLYILKQDSPVFPVKSDPTHPSWVVYSSDGLYPDGSNKLVISIFDAVTGGFLGYGTPPPFTALSINGPDWGATFPSCDPIWHEWMTSAKNGFNAMGYDTEGIDVATEAQIRGHVQSSSTALFYELDHGGSTSFHNICPDSENITGTQVGTWISGYTKMPFAFIGSCGGLCDNGPGTFSYEFRKGSSSNTAAVGYCHMDWTGAIGESYSCTDCWSNSVAWQDNLFNRLKNGETVKDAFDHALADYPMCGDGSQCMRLDGDNNLKLVPTAGATLIRGSLPTANAGLDQNVEQTNLAGTSVTLDGSGSVGPNGAPLTYTWSWTGGAATGVNPTASFPLGTTIATLTVDDGYGSPLDIDERSDTVSITVRDTTPPVLAVPAAVTVEQTSAAGTPVTLPPATATDICDAHPVITNNAPAVFPLGNTTVTFSATDASGNSASGSTTVTVVDTTPPTISVRVTPDTLWPPNHKMADITAMVTVSDICDAHPTVRLVSITSNEPDDANGVGDGETKNDIQGAIFNSEDYRFQLRAERDGNGDGRVYMITYSATDASGNSANGSAAVLVPQNR